MCRTWPRFRYLEKRFLSIHPRFSVEPTTQLREGGRFFTASQGQLAALLGSPTLQGEVCAGEGLGALLTLLQKKHKHKQSGQRSAGGSLKVEMGCPNQECRGGNSYRLGLQVHGQVPQVTSLFLQRELKCQPEKWGGMGVPVTQHSSQKDHYRRQLPSDGCRLCHVLVPRTPAR